MDHQFKPGLISQKALLPQLEILPRFMNKLKDIKSTTCSLHSVKLYETENNYVEYYG